jgi:flagellar basal-body rod protein FlgG
MNDALFIAATGMQVQQRNVDTIANNIVNATTPTFKRSKVSFTDMVSSQAKPAIADGANGLLGTARTAGIGVGLMTVGRQFEAGDLKKTDSPYDVAIRGDGFIEVAMPDGAKAVTRGGTLKVNGDGLLAMQSGLPLKPGIAIPESALSLHITADGRVQVTLPDQTAPQDVGQIELVRFANPDQLSGLGENLYLVTDAAGEVRSGEGAGTVEQGFLENSNVKMLDEMVNLMLAQRAYDASVKVIQASDEMLAAANNLRR